MPDTNPPDTLDTNATDGRFRRFEAAWLARRDGESPPCWREYLPAAEEPCSAEVVFLLVQVDVECRVKAGLPGLLAEGYFEHPRLQQPDARLDDGQQVELIRWEYQQRWQSGQRPRRADYQAAFPRHAGALQGLQPRWRCPRCRRVMVLEEAAPTLRCPDCASAPSVPETVPPFPAVRCLTDVRQISGLRFQVLRPHGKGGIGEVFVARDQELNREVALKEMQDPYARDAHNRGRFVREAEITGGLEHPGVVPVYGLGTYSDGRPFYAMRFIQGETLQDSIRKFHAGQGDWTLRGLLTRFVTMCNTMAYAHSRGVLHRDLKRANVMLGRYGETLIVDWGLAKAGISGQGSLARGLTEGGSDGLPEPALAPCLTDGIETQAGSALGTPSYMSPEQASGRLDLLGPASDIYSLSSSKWEAAPKGED
jgi:hypothetical protein